jgi:NAD(P)H-dependent flavin oxidoreductase YrpB (nitropropane dioxygenase family)
MKNRLTEMFGIEFPVFAFSHCRDVVAAVTNAGGMGVLGALAFSPEQLELELKWIDEHVDGKPYGVDVVMPVKTVDRDEGLHEVKDLGTELRAMVSQEHWDYVDKILRDNGVDPDARPVVTDDDGGSARGGLAAGGVLGWAEATGATQIDVALAHPIAMLASALGPPPKQAIDQAHEQGVKVAALVGRVEQAVRDVQQGVDIIIAQGSSPTWWTRSRPCRCSPPAASAPAGRWPPRWRSVPTVCGPGRSGSP